MKDRKTLYLITIAAAIALIGIGALIIIFVAFVTPPTQPTNTINTQPGTDTTSNSAVCSNYGGTWMQNYNECEGISQEQCTKMSGNFNGCASACRHSSTTQACIQVCVRVCTF